MTRSRKLVTAIAVAAVVGVGAGLAWAHDDAHDADQHDSASETTTTSLPWNELTGPQKSVIMLEQELAIALDKGAQPGDPIITALEEALARARELAAGPPPEPPDPEVVQEILDYESDTEPSWDKGETMCEPQVGSPTYPKGEERRCIAVPQLDKNLILVWLQSDGQAWVEYHRQQGGGLLSDWYDVPVIPNLGDATIEVVDQEIQIILPDQTHTFDTTVWRDELAPKSG